jgi:signal transduction histidine kinase
MNIDRQLAADLGTGTLVVVLLLSVSAGPVTLSGLLAALVAAVALAAVLLRRRALPIAVVLAGVLAGMFPQCGVVLAVVAYTIGVREMGARRRGVLLATLAAVPAVTAPIGIWVLDVRMAIYQVWTVVMVVAVCGAVPALVGVLVRQRQWLTAVERDAADSTQHAHLLAVSEAKLRERARIAVEMHDLLGHRLSLIALHSGGLQLATAADPEAHRAAQLIRSTARQALDELREVLGMLRTGETGDATLALTDETGTRADVNALLAGSRAAGIEITLGWTGDDLTGADENVRRAVHRIVREALTNIHKHAPGAIVAIRVTRTPDRVTVEVTNGPAPQGTAASHTSAGGAGLAGLRERVRLLGGSLRAEPADDGGFAVVADLPLHAGGRQPAPEPATPPIPAEGFRHPLPAARFPRPALAVLAVVAGLFTLVGLASIVSSLTSGTTSKADQNADAPRIGMSVQDFVSSHGAGDPIAAIAAHGQEPVPPADATCLYQSGSVLTKDPLGVGGSTADEITVHRYCFVGERLVDIRDLALTTRVR